MNDTTMKHAFILGNPRSGTTLLRLMLNCHPEIVAPPECGFSHWLFHKYCNWSERNINSTELAIFAEDVLKCKKMETWQLDKDALVSLIEVRNPTSYSDLVDCVYLCYASKREKIKIIVDKNNYYIKHLDDLVKIWNDAIFIHLVRDGRDVACSYLGVNSLSTSSKYKPSLPSEIDEIASEWSTNVSNIHNFLTQLQPEKTITIRYEDLLEDTRKELTSICQKMNIKFSNSMLKYYFNRKEREIEPKATLDWKRKTLKRIDMQNIGRYKSELSLQEVSRFQHIATKELIRYGYIR